MVITKKFEQEFKMDQRCQILLKKIIKKSIYKNTWAEYMYILCIAKSKSLFKVTIEMIKY